MLGPRFRAGGDTFAIGHHSQIRSVALPGGTADALLVANELGDIRLYEGLPTGEPEDIGLRFVGENTPPEGYTIGWSATGVPGQYRYCAVVPRAESDSWDLLTNYHLNDTMEWWRMRSAEPSPVFEPCQPGMPLAGVPEVLDRQRDGRFDLLVGREDGTLVLHERQDGAEDAPPAFSDGGAAMMGACNTPLAVTGPAFPCVLRHGKRRDLLVGTGDGYVMLFRDIGDDDQVAYDRGRRLVAGEDYLRVEGPACPAMIQTRNGRYLLVADGPGRVWAWPIQTARSYTVADFKQAVREAALGDVYRASQWWLAQNGQSDALLAAGPPPPVTAESDLGGRIVVYDPPAPELRIAPPAPGWYEVHLTLVQPEGMKRPPEVEVRAPADDCWTVLMGGELHRGNRHEVFFKTTHLTSDGLRIRQRKGALNIQGGQPAYIESVRLVEIPAPETTVGAPRTVIAGIADAIDWFKLWSVETPEEVDNHVGQHAAAGFQILYHKLGGGCWEYPSEIPGAESVVPSLPDMTEDDKAYCARRIALQERINRVALTAEACHRRNMQCFGWMRIQNHGERIHGKGPLDRFFVDHPEYRERDFEGRTVEGKHCLGHPEVREFHYRLCEEALELGCDGIFMDTLRHLPKVMWGDPVQEAFRATYGCDMFGVPPFDERIVAVQTSIFTAFLRELRERMRKKNRNAELHARICAIHPLMGCDPKTWIREGLVDAIIIEDRLGGRMDDPSGIGLPDIGGLIAACYGTPCRAYAGISRPKWGKEKAPLHPYRIERFAEQALSLGADGISFYETARLIERPRVARAIRRINDPSALPSRLLDGFGGDTGNQD